jgi:hypothetical protein
MDRLRAEELMSGITRGRHRPPDTPMHELEPGDYRRSSEDPTILWCCLPNGERLRLDGRWRIVDGADGTISVEPAEPGGAHSILVEGGEHGDWHGWLVHGVWREC